MPTGSAVTCCLGAVAMLPAVVYWLLAASVAGPGMPSVLGLMVGMLPVVAKWLLAAAATGLRMPTGAGLTCCLGAVGMLPVGAVGMLPVLYWLLAAFVAGLRMPTDQCETCWRGAVGMLPVLVYWLQVAPGSALTCCLGAVAMLPLVVCWLLAASVAGPEMPSVLGGIVGMLVVVANWLLAAAAAGLRMPTVGLTCCLGAAGMLPVLLYLPLARCVAALGLRLSGMWPVVVSQLLVTHVLQPPVGIGARSGFVAACVGLRMPIGDPGLNFCLGAVAVNWLLAASVAGLRMPTGSGLTCCLGAVGMLPVLVYWLLPVAGQPPRNHGYATKSVKD